MHPPGKKSPVYWNYIVKNNIQEGIHMKQMKIRFFSGCMIIIMVIGIILSTASCYIPEIERNPGKWGQARFGRDVFGE